MNYRKKKYFIIIILTSVFNASWELLGDRPLRRFIRVCKRSSSSAVESSSLSLKIKRK
jgi:hypothetical protein